jgi:hypothetical protein
VIASGVLLVMAAINLRPRPALSPTVVLADSTPPAIEPQA